MNVVLQLGNDQVSAAHNLELHVTIRLRLISSHA